MACVCAEYVYDGKTTYCWQVDSSVYATAINSSASVVESSDDNCVISMTVAISSPQVYAGDPVQVSWNATVNLDSKGKLRKNKFGMETLFAATTSDASASSQQKVQIVFSRLQTCTFGVDCDPVLRTSALLQNTSNTATNFTNNMASFSSNELVFSDAGSYSLIGHIILPGEDPKKRRYEFAVFTKVDVTVKSVATSTAPLAESQSGTSQKSQGMKTEVLAVIIIGAIAGVSLIVIGFTTLRTKGKPLAATKKDFREGRFDTNPGVPTVVAGGTVEENDFAMLSMHEMTMSSDRPRANTFLTALARGQTEKNKANPVNYVGPLCQQSFQRNVITVDVGSRSDVNSDDHQVLTLETPLSSRDHMGSYADMNATPKLFSGTGVEEYHQRLKPTSHIMFNDIQEDEVVDDRSPRRKPAVDLEEVSQRIREHANQMLLELQEVESNSKRAALKMTADDLRESVRVEQGRSLKLSDLGGGVQHGLYRYSEDSNYD